MDSLAVRRFVTKYRSRKAVATTGTAGLCVRGRGLACLTPDSAQWQPACELCYIRRDRVRAADSRVSGFQLCASHARRYRRRQQKRRRLVDLDGGGDSNQKRQRGPYSSTCAGEKPHACNQCDARFVQADHLRVHLRVHTGERPHACDECGARFARGGDLQSHMCTHTGERPHACNQCDARFAKAGNLRRHERTHTGERPYACNQCDARFAEAGHRQQHVRTHTGERLYVCNHCNARFAKAGNLRRHERTHTGERPYACNQCKARFADAGTLKKHVRTHTGERPHACNQCDARFADAGNLKKHMRTHTCERPHLCDECGARFARGGDLQSHMRTHTGERPHACNQCDARFADAGNLKKHMRTHTCERPHLCDECGARFARARDLRKHARGHEESRGWRYVCVFASFSTAKFRAGLVACMTRCRTERLLDDHVQRCHTEEGIAQRFRSEQQLAEFLAAQGWAFDRDFANAIYYKHCDTQLKPKLEGAVSSRPDFHLLQFQALPAGRRCVLLLGNDEFAHRRYRCELGRVLKLSTALGANPSLRSLPVVYVRFNPHWFEVDGVLHDPPLQARFERLQRLLTDLAAGRVPEVAGRTGLSLLYLYYDRQTVPTTAEP